MSIVLFGLAEKGEMKMEQLTFRKARPEDLAQVFALFTDAIHTMDKDGIPQWDEVYPDERTLKEDIEHGQLYLAELEGRPAAVFVLNLDYDPQYANGVWAEPDSYLVLHRLCVSPRVQNRGLGKLTVQAAEEQASALGAKALRLDAFKQNPYALRLYERMGYRIVGDVVFRKGPFFLMESSWDKWIKKKKPAALPLAFYLVDYLDRPFFTRRAVRPRPPAAETNSRVTQSPEAETSPV